MLALIVTMENKTLEDYKKTIIENYPTLRDTFAMSALTGLLTKLDATTSAEARFAVHAAYMIAEIMLQVKRIEETDRDQK